MIRDTEFFMKDDVLMVSVGIDRNTAITKEATDDLIKQHSDAHQRFMDEQTEAPNLPSLPSRAQNALSEAGITTVDQLVLMTEEEVYEKTEGIGEKTMQEIKNALSVVGLSLKG